jgi:hypothetical protein
MEALVFSEAAIDFLRGLLFDPNAQTSYELTSGAVSWSDERFFDFCILCRATGSDYAKHLFAYRMSLLVGHPREELRFAWDEVRSRCPEWIGFRAERVTPDPSWRTFVERAEESF